MHKFLSALIVTGVSEARRIAASFVVTVALMAASVAPAWAGPPGPPVDPPPANDILCLVAKFAGAGLSLTGQISVSDNNATNTLVVTFANGTTVTVTYTDNDDDGFQCVDVPDGTDSIITILVNAP